MKNVWLLFLCALLSCIGVVGGEVAPKADEPAGGAVKNAPEIDYKLVYILAGSPEASDEIGNILYDIFSRKTFSGSTFNYYAISKKGEADPEQGGFLCQINIGRTFSHTRSATSGGIKYTTRTATMPCAVSLYIAMDGKWVKAGGGSLTMIAGYSVLDQLEWFICGKLVKLKGSSKPSGVKDVEIKGTIENPLPFGIGNLRIIAPMDLTMHVDWKPFYITTENIPSGGKGQFTITVPLRLPERGGRTGFAPLLWDKAIVCGFTIINEQAAK